MCFSCLQDFDKPSPPQKPLPADPLGRSSRPGHSATAVGVHISSSGPLPIPIPTVPRPPPTIPLPSRSVQHDQNHTSQTGHIQHVVFLCLIKVTPSDFHARLYSDSTVLLCDVWHQKKTTALWGRSGIEEEKHCPLFLFFPATNNSLMTIESMRDTRLSL